MKKLAVWALGLGLTMSVPALAQEAEPAPASPYLGGGLLYEFPDGARDSDNGYGLHLQYGLPLRARPGEAVEFTLFGLERERDADGEKDQQIGLTANWVKSFGLYGWDQDAGVERWLPSFRPYVLAGVAAIQDEGAGDSRIVPGLDAGGGLAFPVGDRGWALRTEALVQGQINDESVPGEDYLIDYQLRLGLRIPLSFQRSARDSTEDLPPAEECGVAVIDPITGRSDCSVDSDRDGVTDTADLCPGTPAGTPVDANGCSVAEVFDMDVDGVPDDADQCPGTASGLAVDEKGCVRQQTVVLDSVRFTEASAELTDEAKALLDQAAAGLASQEMVVEVAGHTDDQGKANYNLMLSLLRAENVRQYLIGKGVNRYRLFVEGYGETRPIAPNDTEEGRAQNRRVDLDELDLQLIQKTR